MEWEKGERRRERDKEAKEKLIFPDPVKLCSYQQLNTRR